MISLHQALAVPVSRLGERVGVLIQPISWSNYHCLDEDVVMRTAALSPHLGQQSTY